MYSLPRISSFVCLLVCLFVSLLGCLFVCLLGCLFVCKHEDIVFSMQKQFCFQILKSISRITKLTVDMFVLIYVNGFFPWIIPNIVMKFIHFWKCCDIFGSVVGSRLTRGKRLVKGILWDFSSSHLIRLFSEINFVPITNLFPKDYMSKHYRTCVKWDTKKTQ